MGCRMSSRTALLNEASKNNRDRSIDTERASSSGCCYVHWLVSNWFLLSEGLTLAD